VLFVGADAPQSMSGIDQERDQRRRPEEGEHIAAEHWTPSRGNLANFEKETSSDQRRDGHSGEIGDVVPPELPKPLLLRNPRIV